MKISNILLLPFLALAACHRDDDKGDGRDTAVCASDDTSVDTATDTSSTDTADTSVTVACADETGTHAVGESWTCPDGCNSCSCDPSGVVVQTEMACPDTGDTGGEVPPDTGSADTGTDTGADTSSSDTGATDTGAPTDTSAAG